MALLPLQFHHLAIRFLEPGPLLPWIGPALRGLLAGGLKERVCAHPPAVRLERWEKCQGCPHQAECPYGVLLEPPAVESDTGGEATRRPLVIAPAWSPSPEARAGLEIPVSVVAAGEEAGSHVLGLLRAFEELGRTRGLGADGTRFELVPLADPVFSLLDSALFPYGPRSVETTLPRLEVELVSPLFLREPLGRLNLRHPGLADLVRASARLLDDLFWLHAGESLGPDIAALGAAAEEVSVGREDWEPFTQPHLSTRGRTRYPLRGVAGRAEYHGVPESLVPWLTWGGMLHAGSHRVAGAGGWRTTAG